MRVNSSWSAATAFCTSSRLYWSSGVSVRITESCSAPRLLRRLLVSLSCGLRPSSTHRHAPTTCMSFATGASGGSRRGAPRSVSSTHMSKTRWSAEPSCHDRQLPARSALASDSRVSREISGTAIPRRLVDCIKDNVIKRCYLNTEQLLTRSVSMASERWSTGVFEPSNACSADCCVGWFCPCFAFGHLVHIAQKNGIDIGDVKDWGPSACSGFVGVPCCIHLFLANIGLPCIPPCLARKGYREKVLGRQSSIAVLEDACLTCFCPGCVYSQVTFHLPVAHLQSVH
ncbi:MAG: hypothetical protein EBR09_12725 [Proteobacteria bacterium]|nr:hypothetical protein [Pseudomonadota bacterium]